MSEFEVDRDNDYEWVCVGGNVLFAEDCAAIMNQQAETIKQLKTKLAESEVRVARLVELGTLMVSESDDETAAVYLNQFEKALNETKSQSLQHIQAEAVEKAIAYADEDTSTHDAWIGRIMRFAKQLRQQQTNGGEVKDNFKCDTSKSYPFKNNGESPVFNKRLGMFENILMENPDPKPFSYGGKPKGSDGDE